MKNNGIPKGETSSKKKYVVGALLGVILIVVAVYLGAQVLKAKTLTLTGDIENNVISANSTVSGKIVLMDKSQGEKVKKGDIIAEIDSQNQVFAVEQLQAVVDLKRAKLDELKAGARPQQIKQLEALTRGAKAQWDLLKAGNRVEQKDQAELAVAIAKKAVETAKISKDYAQNQYETAKAIADMGDLSQQELDGLKYKVDLASQTLATANDQLNNVKSQLTLIDKGATVQSISSAKANYDSAKAQLDLMKAGATSQSIRMAEADLNQSIAQLKQAKSILDNYKIVALADGIIISKNYQLGDIVNVASNLADIAIEGDLYVITYIPDKYLDRVSYGEKLEIKTGVGVIQGTVNYIALKHEYTPKDKQSTNDSKHKATKIKIKISDASGVLKSGMTGEIKVPLK